jgi:hypothetical protein
LPDAADRFHRLSDRGRRQLALALNPSTCHRRIHGRDLGF